MVKWSGDPIQQWSNSRVVLYYRGQTVKWSYTTMLNSRLSYTTMTKQSGGPILQWLNDRVILYNLDQTVGWSYTTMVKHSGGHI